MPSAFPLGPSRAMSVRDSLITRRVCQLRPHVSQPAQSTHTAGRLSSGALSGGRPRVCSRRRVPPWNKAPPLRLKISTHCRPCGRACAAVSPYGDSYACLRSHDCWTGWPSLGGKGACTLCLSLVSRDQEELAARAPNLTLPSALSGPGLGFGREGEGKGYYFASVNGKSPIEP